MMPALSTYDGFEIYGDEFGGAINLDDGLWYPFGYFDSGKLDIVDCEGFTSYTDAYDKYKGFFT